MNTQSRGLATAASILLLTTAGTLSAQDTLHSNNFEDGSMGPWSASGGDAGLYENGDTPSNVSAGEASINFAPNGNFSLWEGRAASFLVLTDPLPLGSRGYTSVTISFNWVCRNSQATRRLNTEYSPDNGVTWQNLGNVAGPTASFSSGSGTYTINAPAVALTDQAKFRFTFTDGGGAAGPFFIDDIVIAASPEFTGNFWDTDGATDGSGGATPTGTWGVDSFWSTSPDGDEATGAWTPGEVAVFSAGSDATGAYTVTVDGTQDISGLSFKDGTPTLTGGTLSMVSDSFAFVGDGLTAAVASAITDDTETRVLSRTGNGTLILSGSNSGASGSMVLNSGITRFDAPVAIIGTGENLTINSGGILIFGGSFDTTTIQSALNDRLVTSSAGVIAVDGNLAVDFDFATAGLTAAYLGALADTTYTGLLTPNGTTYRLGGAGGKLTVSDTSGKFQASPNIEVLGDVEISGDITGFTGTLTKQNSGTLTLSGANSYSANTTASGGTLVLAGSNSTASQTTINAATVQLASSSNGGLASGQITLNNNSAVLQAVDDDRSINNNVLLNASPTISGPQSLTINGAMTINNNRQLNNNIDSGKELVLASQINLSNNNTARTLTIRADSLSADVNRGKTIISGNIVNGGTGAGNLTLTSGWRESEPFYLSGTNTYSGLTNLTNGWVYFQGMQALSPNTTVRLDHTSGSNGRIALLDDASGNINLPNPFEVRANNATGNHRFFVGNNNTANGGTSSGTTADSTFVIPSLDYIIAQAGNSHASIDLDGANGYSLRIHEVNLPNANIRTANNNWEARFNPTSARFSLGDITMAAGNALQGIPILALQGTTSGNVITGDISEASDSLTTGRPLNLTKSGTSEWTLSGENTYTGTTTVSQGTLALVGGSQSSPITVSNGARLGFTLGSPTTSSSTLTLSAGHSIAITGTAARPASYLLITASSITGTPNLSSAIDGYELRLKNSGTELWLVWAVYDDWAATFLPDDVSDPTLDFDNDTLTNLQEFAFGTDPTVSFAGPIEWVANGAVTTPGKPVAVNFAALGDPVDFRAVFGRRKHHEAAGLTYTVQFSAGLDIWVDSTATPTVLTDNTGGDIEAVSVPYPLFIPVTDGFKKPTFFRVGITMD